MQGKFIRKNFHRIESQKAANSNVNQSTIHLENLENPFSNIFYNGKAAIH